MTGGRWIERSRPLLAVLWFCALAVIVCWPIFRGRFFIWDVPDQYWADLRYLCGSLHDGEWPLWNPYDRGGYPFHADPQSGMYYPLNWALCAVSGRDSGLIWTELRVPIHFALAGCAMTGFLRAISLSWGAAIVGGTAFMFAPFQRRMWEVNLTYTIAYVPALLWAIERLAQEPRWRRAGALALVAALAASVGSPPALYFTVLVAGPFAIARCGRARETWPWLSLAGVLAVAMIAVMIVPTAALSHESVQQAHDYASISAGAYPLRALPGLVWPDHLLLYIGAPAFGLALLGAFSPRSGLPRAHRWCFGLLAMFGLGMMFGDATVLYRAMYRVLPGVSAFRLPTRYSAVMGAAVAVLAAGGVSALPTLRGAASPLALALYLASVWPALPPARSTMPGPVPGGRARYDDVRATVGDVENSWRIFDEFGIGLRAGTRYGFREFRGYQDPLMLGRFERIVGKLAEYPRVLEQFNVRYLLRGPHYIHGVDHRYLPDGVEGSFARPLGGSVWETTAPLPAAYWVPRAEVLPDGEAVLAAIRARAPTPECMLESADGPAGDASAAGASMVAATDVHVGRNDLALHIVAPADGWLVVNEAFYPGWRAEIDGRDVPVRRANFLVRALRVPAGAHRVTMAYRPRGYRWLAGISLAAALGALGMLVLRTRERHAYRSAAR